MDTPTGTGHTPQTLPRISSRARLHELRLVWVLVALSIGVLFASYGPISPLLALILKVVFLTAGVATVFIVSIRLARANESLARASRQLENVIANLKDGVIVYDNDFTVHMFNAAAEEIFGIKKDAVVGKRCGPERVQEKDLRFFTQVMFPSLAPQSIQRSEPGKYPQIIDLSFSEPVREMRTYTIPLLDDEGKVIRFMKTVEDRTREVQLQRSKSQFISVAAHQLRTPLTAIQWIFEILTKSPVIQEDDRKVAEDGIQASTKLLKIVNDLLDVSRIEEGRFGYEFKEVKVSSFIEEILKRAMTTAAQYEVSLYFDRGAETETVVYIDPDKLGMAFANFVDNAIKYNVKNGSVTVKLERLGTEPYVQVSVKDTGIGIPPEAMNELFKKFFRAENVSKVYTEGSGLGLFIAKNIIERHGGSVWAESVLKRGTTFFFTLPTDPSLIPSKEIGYTEE